MTATDATQAATELDPLSIAADLIDPPDDTWTPLPFQIPPPGKWYSWLLLGGRGAGKTAAAARHIHEHIP